jgi:hypothetical protein
VPTRREIGQALGVAPNAITYHWKKLAEAGYIDPGAAGKARSTRILYDENGEPFTLAEPRFHGEIRAGAAAPPGPEDEVGGVPMGDPLYEHFRDRDVTRITLSAREAAPLNLPAGTVVYVEAREPDETELVYGGKPIVVLIMPPRRRNYFRRQATTSPYRFPFGFSRLALNFFQSSASRSTSSIPRSIACKRMACFVRPSAAAAAWTLASSSSLSLTEVTSVTPPRFSGNSTSSFVCVYLTGTHTTGEAVVDSLLATTLYYET